MSTFFELILYLMLGKISSIKATIIKHSIVWIGVYLLYYSVNLAKCSPQMMFGFAACITICDILTYYFIYFFIYPLAEKEKYWLVAIGYIISYAIHFTYALLIYKVLFPNIDIDHPRSNYGFIAFLQRDLRWYCELFVFAYAGMLTRIGIARTKLFNSRAEFLLNQELGLLKNQFHSHLSFNFLSFCYVKLLKISTAASLLVENYSSMLRYTLLANDEKKIRMQDEIEYLNSFIAVQKHLSSNVYCNFSIKSDDSTVYIAPMLLGVLVEIAFKYGQIDNSKKPIFIDLRIVSNELAFSIQFISINMRSLNLSQNNTIEQLHKYLRSYYNDNYNLECFTTVDNIITIVLNMNLNEKDRV